MGLSPSVCPDPLKKAAMLPAPGGSTIPKFGNDLDEVDAMYARVANRIVDALVNIAEKEAGRDLPVFATGLTARS
jgi:hypothetical protein